MKAVTLLAVMLVVGCSSQRVPSLAEVNNTNIKKLRGAYGLYLFQHDLRGPENEEELKEYLRTDEGAQVKLGRMGMTVDQIDSIFISERDGQPFKVRYGLRGLGDHAVAFEAEGVDGKRMVALSIPREVDDAEYERLWNQKRPAPEGVGL
ncbi:hypothetical protein MalM25_21930 [Planctomycetes bacterium MalM25]|nr:hypothetical protein MalM25_21930 [Planctomycetes bacterium MalM25]